MKHSFVSAFAAGAVAFNTCLAGQRELLGLSSAPHIVSS